MTDMKDVMADLAWIGEQLKLPVPPQQEQPPEEVHEMLARELAAHQSRWLSWDEITGGRDAA